MGEHVSKRDYGHLRANVPTRRKAYWAFLWIAIAVFVVSILDILFFEEVLFWGVIAAYVILFVWGIVLLFSRRWADDEEDDFVGVVDDEPASGDWRNDGRVQHLRCVKCAHVFGFDMKHIDDDKAHVAFNCPECGATGKMPRPNAEVVEAVVPGGRMKGPRFECHDCNEQWAVGAIGHEPKADVKFDACPHCQSMSIGRVQA